MNGAILGGLILLVGSGFALLVHVVDGSRKQKQFKEAEWKAFQWLSITKWKYTDYDETIRVRSAGACQNYDMAKFFKEHRDKLDDIKDYLAEKMAYASRVKQVMQQEELKELAGYPRLCSRVENYLPTLCKYRVLVLYVSPAGKRYERVTLNIDKYDLECPEKYMTETELKRYQKGQEKSLLKQRQDACYERINKLIDSANNTGCSLVITDDKNFLDDSIALLLGQTDRIGKIKTSDSGEWDIVDTVISDTEEKVKDIFERNKEVAEYYDSEEFRRIKDTCNSLMESQREFNEYISEKADAISSLFGTRVVRNETVTNDEYAYIRPYKKSITPFTAQVSSTVFASAENSPMEYVVKYFYTDKALYPEQIRKLQLLIEDLETLRDARNIIDNYKKDYQEYIEDVPKFIMEYDEAGFYSRLGFANISEDALTVEYKFSYTSEGGFAQRSFTVPMTEENIVALIERLQSRLTMSAFAKEQRSLMTSKLRQRIKERDDYTCRYCGNSTHKEPNLLLEIDHILPVAKGGCTVEDNLQTLCWRCNRKKSDKVVEL